MKKDRILVMAAHPDDDVLGCGGFLFKKSKTSEIKVVFVAEGTSARYKEKTQEVEEKINKRNLNAVEALKVLGIKQYEFYNLPCCRLDQVPIIDIGKIVEKEIELFRPNIVLTHNSCDVNVDHKLVFQAVLQATRPSAKNFVSKVFCFEILSSTEWKFEKAFEPNLFVQLTKEEIQKKIESLKKYKSEMKCYPFPRSEEGVMTLAKYRGMQAGVKYAEAFKILREII